MRKATKPKALNDPVYGFISIPSGVISDLIEHPYFQRLRRIDQTGLSSLVYPGAKHTRFQHALGCLHLMTRLVRILRQKGHDISSEEETGAQIAILLHDIGHGPFSHALETAILPIPHEWLSLRFMYALNEQFDGALDVAIQIFNGSHPKKFLHQLVSGQLDVDRLDYLRRDSFYTGVNEGIVNFDRLIHMMEVHDGALVVEQKGIYAVEKFLIARRLMYWQVYLHKTSFVAERMLQATLKRARQKIASLEGCGAENLLYFLDGQTTRERFTHADLKRFASLDDSDITYTLKCWAASGDDTLALLSARLLRRDLLKIAISDQPFDPQRSNALRRQVKVRLGLSPKYFVYEGQIENRAYRDKGDSIRVLFKDGTLKEVSLASDQLNISALTKPVVKNYLCYPKELSAFVGDA